MYPYSKYCFTTGLVTIPILQVERNTAVLKPDVSLHLMRICTVLFLSLSGLLLGDRLLVHQQPILNAELVIAMAEHELQIF